MRPAVLLEVCQAVFRGQTLLCLFVEHPGPLYSAIEKAAPLRPTGCAAGQMVTVGTEKEILPLLDKSTDWPQLKEALRSAGFEVKSMPRQLVSHLLRAPLFAHVPPEPTAEEWK